MKKHSLQWLILTAISITTTLAVYSTVSTVLLGQVITDSLAIDGARSSWITIIYLLGANTIVPIANRIADRLGYKKVFLLGVALFFLGTLGSGLSQNFFMITTSRLIEGVGSGFIYPVGLAIIVQSFSKKHLSVAINIYMAAVFGIGFAGGSIVSGYYGFLNLWRGSFLWTLIPISLSFVIACILCTETKRVQRGSFDYAGFFFFASFVSCIIVFLEQGNLPSTNEGWRSSYIIFCMIGAVVFMIATLLLEKGATNPIIPLPLFKYATFTTGSMTLFAIGSVIFSTTNVAVEYMQEGLLYDRLKIGKILSIYGTMLGIGPLIANLLMKKISPTILSVFGLCVLICSLFLSNIISIQSSEVPIIIMLTVRGLAVGISVGPVVASALKALPKELGSDGSTMLTFFRQVGATYGGSIFSLIAIRRNIFHKEIFFTSMNQHLSAYKNAVFNLKNEVFAGSLSQGAMRAKVEIIDYVNRQSYIQSLNDANIFMGYIVMAMTILLCISNILTYLQKKRREKHHLETAP